MNSIPNLLDTLVDLTKEPIKLFNILKGQKNNTHSYFSFPLFTPAQMERTLQLLHIFRNFSFLPNCVPLLLNNQQLLLFIQTCLTFRFENANEKCPLSNVKIADTDPSELRVYSLEILENLSLFMEIKGRSHCFVQIVERIILYSNDRALIVPAIRCLANFISNVPIFTASR